MLFCISSIVLIKCYKKNGYYRVTTKTGFAQLPLKNKGDLCC